MSGRFSRHKRGIRASLNFFHRRTSKMRGRGSRWECFLVIKEPLHFFCEIANFSIDVVGQRVSEFPLNRFDVFTDCFHWWNYAILPIHYLEAVRRIIFQVFLPLWPKEHTKMIKRSRAVTQLSSKPWIPSRVCWRALKQCPLQIESHSPAPSCLAWALS